MAQTAYIDDIAPDVDLRRNISCLQLGIIHEPVASAIGSGPNRPYVGLFLQLQATGNVDVTPDTYGKLRVVAVYGAPNSGETDELLNTSDPFNARAGDGGDPIIPAAAPAWYRCRADGFLEQVAAAPADATVLPSGSAANARNRFPLSADKNLLAVVSYWTPV